MTKQGMYRGKRVDSDGKTLQEIKQDNTVGAMPFLYGDKFEIGGKVYIVLETATVEDVDGDQMLYGFAEVIPESVGQSTGMKENGTEIYANDIMEDVSGKRYIIEWEQGGIGYVGCRVGGRSGITRLDMLLELTELDAKVIGNTTDQPELLEKQT